MRIVAAIEKVQGTPSLSLDITYTKTKQKERAWALPKSCCCVASLIYLVDARKRFVLSTFQSHSSRRQLMSKITAGKHYIKPMTSRRLAYRPLSDYIIASSPTIS